VSNFGSTGSFRYSLGDESIVSFGTLITLSEQDMPQYPWEETRITDQVTYRSKTGQVYSYQNYNKVAYFFNWSNLSETKRNELATMVNAIPLLTFISGGNLFGTFRVKMDSFSSSETSFGLYDVSFEVEQNA
jgi:hypothetical protein